MSQYATILLRYIFSFSFLQTNVNLIRQTILFIAITVTLEQTFDILHLLLISFADMTIVANHGCKLFDEVGN